MKTTALKILTSLFVVLFTLSIKANVIVTAATGGGSLCSGSYTTLGDIIITEGATTDITASQNNKTLILTAPTGYEFNPGVGSVTFKASRDLSSPSISVAQYTITVTFTSDGFANRTDIITITGIQAKASNSTPVASSGNILRKAANLGTGTIAGITNDVTNFGTLTQADALAYSSSAVTQNFTNNIGIGSNDNEIIGIKIVVTGTCPSISATSFTLNTTGSSNPAEDITNASIYYTGTSSTFATTTLFGSSASPDGTFTITGSASLSLGTNYFWLAYDIASGATLTHIVDGQCTSVTVEGTPYTPSPTTVTGFRGISRCPTGFMENGANTVVNGNFSSGSSGFSSSYTYVANDPADPDELWPEGYYSVWTSARDVHPNWSKSTKGKGGSGNFLIVNGNTVDNIVVWTQTVTVSTNTNYYFCAWLCSVHPLNPAQLSFSVNGTNIGSTYVASTDTVNHWDEFFATWESEANTSAVISIVNKNIIANGNDFGLDDISFVPCVIGTLPVEFLNFDADVICDEVNLNWVTASETNNDYFTVEKSKDGKDFFEIVKIDGAGNSNSALNYSYIDYEPYNGISYYRLKQTDFDGKFSYSEMKSVNIEKVDKIVFFPNPTNDILNITIPDGASYVIIDVSNVIGSKVYSETFNKESLHNNMLSLDVKKTFGQGIYLVNVIVNSLSAHFYSEKIIVY